MRKLARGIRQYSGLAALILVLTGFASAATGNPLLLGKSNTANKPTVVQNTGTGPVLDLKAKAGQPPLKVNSSKLVPMLNAAQLQGKGPSAFATVGSSFSKTESDNKYLDTSEAYTKAQANTAFMENGEAYTKAQADAAFMENGEAYTKAQADTAFMENGQAYSTTTSDARYGRILLSSAWSGTTANDATPVSVLNTNVAVPGPGTLFTIFSVDSTPAHNKSDLYVNGPLQDEISSTIILHISRNVGFDVPAATNIPFQVTITSEDNTGETSNGTLVVLFFPR